jgi:hypothetical protein
MPGQQGFDHAGVALKGIGLDFTAALQRPQRLRHPQHMVGRGRVEMVGKKLVDLNTAETTLRLQHQADGGRGRRVQTSQTVLNHMDGLMGQYIQLKPWLIAQPLRQTQSVYAHVVSSSFGSGATTIKAINDNTKLLKPIDQTIRPS